MSKKKKTKTSKRRSPARKKTTRKTLDSTQMIAIGVIVLVVVLVGWLSLPKEKGKAADSKQYDAPPKMSIDETRQYFATIEIEKGGEFVIELYPDKAPLTVNSFVFLAREGFYDGTTFHRVLPNFMAQGGDPTGTGGGGPGYEFENEYSDLTFDRPGVVAMANAGVDTNGSQFFVTFSPQEYLNGGYTIFGQVVEGMEVVMNLTLRDPQQNPNYVGDVIKRITIEER